MTSFFLLPSKRSIHTFSLDGVRFAGLAAVLVFLVCFISHELKGFRWKRKLPAKDKLIGGEQTEKRELLDDCWRIKILFSFSQPASVRAF